MVYAITYTLVVARDEPRVDPKKIELLTLSHFNKIKKLEKDNSTCHQPGCILNDPLKKR